MLSTGLCTVLALVGVAIGVYAARLAYKALLLAQAAQVAASKKSDLTPSQAELLELSTEMTDIRDALHSLREQLKRLRSRIGMRELRDRRANGTAPADETTDAKKARLRREILEKRGKI